MTIINKKKKPLIIAFMGVDGSGKTTIIRKLIKNSKKKFQKIKYLHLRPYFFLTDKRTIIKKPHNHKKNISKFFSFFKIIMWLVIYRIFFFINSFKVNQLIIFDRYAHDLLIDPIRYDFKLSKKLTKFILNLFPEPDVWIILTASDIRIEERKKELSRHELKKQKKLYLNFSRSKNNSFIVNTNIDISKNIEFIKKKLI